MRTKVMKKRERERKRRKDWERKKIEEIFIHFEKFSSEKEVLQWFTHKTGYDLHGKYPLAKWVGWFMRTYRRNEK